MKSVDTYVEFYNTKRPTARSTTRHRIGSNCSMSKGEDGQADLNKEFETECFLFFNHQACIFHLYDMDYRAVHEERERLKYQGSPP